MEPVMTVHTPESGGGGGEPDQGAGEVGWAYKHQKLRQTWTKRLFFVADGHLCYNKAASIRRKVPIYGATLKFGNVVSVPKLTLYLLSVVSAEHVVLWTVGFPSAAERLKWIARFEHVAGHNTSTDYSSELTVINLPDELCEGVVPSFGSPLPVHSCNALILAINEAAGKQDRLQISIPQARSCRKILCVLSQEFADVVSLCPALPSCVLLLLLTLPDDTEAYRKARDLLRNSLKGRWFLPLRQHSIAEAFEMRLKVVLPEVDSVIESLGFSARTLFEPWVDCALSFLPIPVLGPVFKKFLEEGASVWLQVGLNALRLHSLLREGWPFSDAAEFKASLSAAVALMGPGALLDSRAEVMAPDFNTLLHETSPRTSHYRHRAFRAVEVTDPSCILTDDDWLCLTSWLPAAAEPYLLFSTQKQGYSMETMLRCVNKQPHVLVVEVKGEGKEAEVFGCFIPNYWRDNNPTPGECFVFTLRPLAVKYAGTGVPGTPRSAAVAYSLNDSLSSLSAAPFSLADSTTALEALCSPTAAMVSRIGVASTTVASSLSTALEEESKGLSGFAAGFSSLADVPETPSSSVGRRRVIMHARANAISIGGPVGAFALSLDANLRTGFSVASEAFLNPPLCSAPLGNFQVAAVECWGVFPHEQG